MNIFNGQNFEALGSNRRHLDDVPTVAASKGHRSFQPSATASKLQARHAAIGIAHRERVASIARVCCARPKHTFSSSSRGCRPRHLLEDTANKDDGGKVAVLMDAEVRDSLWYDGVLDVPSETLSNLSERPETMRYNGYNEPLVDTAVT